MSAGTGLNQDGRSSSANTHRINARVGKVWSPGTSQVPSMLLSISIDAHVLTTSALDLQENPYRPVTRSAQVPQIQCPKRQEYLTCQSYRLHRSPVAV